MSTVLSVPAAPVAPEVRASRARVPLRRPSGWFGRLMNAAGGWMYGQPMDTATAMSGNRAMLLSWGVFELGVARWRALDPQLKLLAELAVAVRIECGWCLDFGYFEGHRRGVDLAKLRAVPQWRTATLFTPLERLVLEYAEAATATPPEVTDDMTESLRAELGDAAVVELTMMVAVENLRSRFNAALGLQSQGFAEACRVPGEASP
ncbi:carboxymuconolactone decarboxylase family protein [Nakamurella leprariae]|uniref:Carboxymuconolactone decarboxylase family protein n=1 Tax=Nakamurella leprariae TaxID=2803911 RepID=A0A939BXW9_9ACTN|nr:carboxymuconolactone decarboxylase family protein [Nakamurella leprariae]MBM9466016.1 carboxymuconolactone decarboxylase family protein [Nakamurella leprariae]